MIFNLGLKGLPFEPHSKQIIYVENSYDKEVNEYIQRYYESICAHFESQGYKFVYLPLLSKRFDMKLRSYYNPASTICRNIPVKSSLILDFMAHPENRDKIKPSLLYVNQEQECEEGEDIVLRGITIDSHSSLDPYFDQYIQDIIDDISSRNIKKLRLCKSYNEESYSIARDEILCCCRYEELGDSLFEELCPPYKREKQSADDTFDEDTRQLMQEVRDKINELRRKGIEQYVLEDLLRGSVEVSRMVITPDYRILLSDYNNMEIEMTPLVKAVYILFLRHPEGIAFKCLRDYEKELLAIYSDVREGFMTREMKRSVEAATDPLNNSINEKCARIREAFISKFDESLITPYIIQGKRGCPKAISLPREKVEWQTK